MPQKTSSTSALPARQSPWRRYRAPIIFVIVLLLLGGLIEGWNIYQKRAIQADKARFAQAEKDVEGLSQAIIAVQKPETNQGRNYCTESKREFAKSTFSCNANIDLVFAVKDSSEAQSKYLVVDRSLQKNTQGWMQQAITMKPSDSLDFVPLKTQDEIETLNKTYSSLNQNISCDVSYQYYSEGVANPTVDISSHGPQTLLVTLGCTGDAIGKIY